MRHGRNGTRTDKLQAAHERLAQAVEAIVSGDDWKRMLRVSAKFHRYTFNNQLLIFLQRPDATLVAGFRRWQELGRQVRKGERGISTLAPCKHRVPSENGPSAASPDGKDTTGVGSGSAVEVAAPAGERPKTELRGFRVAHVFDVSQTDGEPIEGLDAVRPKLLEGEAPAGLWDASRRGEALDPPLLIVLDEAANIAALPELDTLASTASAHGIQLVSVFHDLSQIIDRYGESAATVVNNHRGKIILSGVSDTHTLEYVSRLLGDEEVIQAAVTRAAMGEKSTTSSTTLRSVRARERVARDPAG